MYICLRQIINSTSVSMGDKRNREVVSNTTGTEEGDDCSTTAFIATSKHNTIDSIPSSCCGDTHSEDRDPSPSKIPSGSVVSSL